ncbi:MAG: ABC transporter substrate-binding protein [Anaerolineales bacterium]|nr:ABC transporter substrate-binding protein [Anaerolineales bacterium]
MLKKINFMFLILMLLATACSGGQATESSSSGSTAKIDADGHITIEFWYALGGDTGKVVEEMVKQFNESQSEITVNATYQGDYASAMAKVWSAVSAGGLPSVAQIGGAPLLGSTGAVAPITEFLNGSDGIDQNAIRQVFWDYNSAGGVLWTMPFNLSIPVMYYNRDLFTAAGLDPTQPPQTWDELIEMAGKLTVDTNNNGEIDQWGVNTSTDTHYYLSAMFLSNGVQIVSDDESEVLYNNAEAVEMLTLWGNLVNEYKVMPPNQHEEAKSDFLAGKLGILMASSSNVPSMEANASFEVGVAQMPAVNDKPRVFPVGGASLLIFKDESPEIQNAAWTFVKFMTSKESSIYLSTHTGYLPIYTDAAEWPEFVSYIQEHPNRGAPIEGLNNAVAIPEFPALGTSDSSLRRAVASVELNSATPQEALAEAKRAVDATIKEQGTNE